MSDTAHDQSDSDRKLSQIDKFKEAARELETDDSEEAFDAKLKKIAKSKPAEKSEKDQHNP